MNVWMSADEQAEVWDRYEAGEYMRPIARAIGRSSNAVRDLIAKTGGVRPLVPTEWSDARLSLAEREEISRGIAQGISARQIAGGLGRAPPRSRGRSSPTEAARTTDAARPKPRLAGVPGVPNRPSWPDAEDSGRWWRRSSKSAGHLSKSPTGCPRLS
jgi:hypothetical protein